MLGKLSPMLLISTSVGGGLLIANYGFRDFRVSSFSVIGDGNWLRERNPSAFQLEKTGLGDVWKTGAVGDIFKDETYYVFQDWSWLNGVKISSANGQSFKGGENLKNYIDGIGFKVIKVDSTDKWEKTEWERTRKIGLKRVLISNYEGYKYGGGYKLFNKPSCLLRTSTQSSTTGPQIYLLMGWASGGSEVDDGKRPENFRLSDGYSDFCDWYDQGKYSHGTKNSISLSFNLADGKTITGKEFPVIADNKSYQAIYFKEKETIIHPIVLGVAIKGHMQAGQVGKRAGERLTKEQATKAIRNKIHNQVVGIYNKDNKSNMIGLLIKEDSQTIHGEVTEQNDWGANATFKYQYY